MRHNLAGLDVHHGRRRERCQSSIEAAGGYVVVVEAMLVDRQILLVSTYLAEVDGRTAVSHLAIIGSAPARLSQRMVERMPGKLMPGRACWTTLRRCALFLTTPRKVR